MALEDCKVLIGDREFAHKLDPSGVQVHFADDDLQIGTYDIVLTAVYRGAKIRAAYFEGLQRVSWNKDANAQQYIVGSPIVAQAAYVIGGALTDAELELLKAEYREKIAAAEQAEQAAEQAKAEWEEKAAQLDDVAQQTTLVEGIASVLQGFAPLATKTQLNTVAQDILDALSHISPEDPNSKALTEFFGVTLLQGYEFMTDTEVTDDLEEIMQLIDTGLTAEQAATITAEAMQIIVRA